MLGGAGVWSAVGRENAAWCSEWTEEVSKGELNMERPSVGDGIRWGLRWAVEDPDPFIRGVRAVALAYALAGFEAFPGCRTVSAICETRRISRKTFYAQLHLLRTFGLALYGPVNGADPEAIGDTSDPGDPCKALGCNDEGAGEAG